MRYSSKYELPHILPLTYLIAQLPHIYILALNYLTFDVTIYLILYLPHNGNAAEHVQVTRRSNVHAYFNNVSG